MSRIVVINHITLYGVMRAPRRADEDTRGGFEHGGCSPPYGDDVMGATPGPTRGLAVNGHLAVTIRSC
jgi:hypothetical protein